VTPGHSSVASVLRLRDEVRRRLRGLFEAEGFLEVDTPSLAGEVLPEPFIDPLHLELADGDRRFLQASPEAHMKRLLAAGSGPIYQFARCFRDGERGPRHDLEFVLLEWYAPGTTLDDTAGLLGRMAAAILGRERPERIGCREAFRLHAGIDPFTATPAALAEAAARGGIALPESHATGTPAERFDRLFELLLAEAVGPRLGHGRPVMLEAWPASQAAFARVVGDRPPIARRFELFIDGVELANGWEEETCPRRLRERIEQANQVRLADGRQPLPLPERFLAAHEPALPEGVGVALGFDRLVMLAASADSIDAVRCFSSETA